MLFSFIDTKVQFLFILQTKPSDLKSRKHSSVSRDELMSPLTQQASWLCLVINITSSVQTFQLGALWQYQDLYSHHIKTISIVFLVMTLSGETGGYGRHVQTSHDMTHTTKQHRQTCSWCQWHHVSDTKSRHPWENIRQWLHISSEIWKLLKYVLRCTASGVSPNVIKVNMKGKKIIRTTVKVHIYLSFTATGLCKINPLHPAWLARWWKKGQLRAVQFFPV